MVVTGGNAHRLVSEFCSYLGSVPGNRCGNALGVVFGDDWACVDCTRHGHAVGREVHEDPQVPNIGRPGFGAPLREGMVLAIEPMISLGTDRIKTLADRWTVITEDRTRSAHFEHTVAIMADGPRILTAAGDPAHSGAV